MIIYPAIDLRGGRCVRLRQGDFTRETVYADDPVAAAERWAAEGATWLHVVNLDGALGRSGEANLAALGRIRRAVGLSIQFGGGLRALDDVARVVDLGVARVVLGTVAIRRPEVVEGALAHHGAERVAVGIDARDGRVAIEGWVDVSEVEAADLGRRMAALGIRRVVYTDVSRDGMLTGPNVAATAALARETGLGIIASGGVSSLEDLERLAAHEAEGIEGAIIGMALYTGRVALGEALARVGGKTGDER
jgi:phosphoribosylformimino-5-aminoimidazole carboxamide ribotide isomerase